MNANTRTERSVSLGWATLTAAFAYVLAIGLPHWMKLGLTGRTALSILSFAAFIWFTVAEVRVSRTLDELQQKIQFEALAIAYPCSILMIIGLGFADAAGVSIGPMPYLKLWPLALLFYGAALILVRRRYQ